MFVRDIKVEGKNILEDVLMKLIKSTLALMRSAKSYMDLRDL
jgi:hypothetical protein